MKALPVVSGLLALAFAGCILEDPGLVESDPRLGDTLDCRSFQTQESSWSMEEIGLHVPPELELGAALSDVGKQTRTAISELQSRYNLEPVGSIGGVNIYTSPPVGSASDDFHYELRVDSQYHVERPHSIRLHRISPTHAGANSETVLELLDLDGDGVVDTAVRAADGQTLYVVDSYGSAEPDKIELVGSFPLVLDSCAPMRVTTMSWSLGPPDLIQEERDGFTRLKFELAFDSKMQCSVEELECVERSDIESCLLEGDKDTCSEGSECVTDAPDPYTLEDACWIEDDSLICLGTCETID